MWTYKISTGVISRLGQQYGIGYAGGNIPPNHDPSAVNNPDRVQEHCIGPLPPGKYTIGSAHTDAKLGSIAMRLFPDPTNEMFGRAGFFIHADSIEHPGQASEGCIVAPPHLRQFIASSTDTDLLVEV